MITNIGSVTFPASPGKHDVKNFVLGSVRRVDAVGGNIRLWVEATDVSAPAMPCTFTVLRGGPNTLDKVGGFVGSTTVGGVPVFIYGSCFL